jgi:hypothetical protein
MQRARAVTLFVLNSRDLVQFGVTEDPESRLGERQRNHVAAA